MTSDFDPYYEWLGIPASDQPPSHYRLLGVSDFETNPGVIQNAAERQAVYLRTLQNGQNVALSERLLNEITRAKICLLSSKAKAEYDQQLRQTVAHVVEEEIQPIQSFEAVESLPEPKPLAASNGVNLSPFIYGVIGVLGLLFIVLVVSALITGSENGDSVERETDGSASSSNVGDASPSAAKSETAETPTDLKPGLLLQLFPKLPIQQPQREYVDPQKIVGAPTSSRVMLDVHHLISSRTHNSVFTGYIKIEKHGDYVFHTYTDWDRNTLWINGKVVSPFRGTVTGGTDSGDVNLSKERITLEKGHAKLLFVVYSHANARNVIAFRWAPPGATTHVPVPPSVLFHRHDETEIKPFVSVAE